MSVSRRKEIAAIAERYGIWLIEDDVHAFLPPEPPPPIASFAGSRTIYLASVAKCLNPGLRTGFVVAPPALRERLLSGVRSTIWMPPPLMTELTCRWLEDGTADQLLTKKRAENAERQGLAQQWLGAFELRSDPSACHLWLALPAPWRSDEFVKQAGQRCVRLAGSEAFAVGRDDLPHAVRISLGNVVRRQRLEQGLRILAEILHECTDPYINIV